MLHAVSTSQEDTCTAAEEGDIRVIGQTNEDVIAGRVELCYEGLWRAVCAGGWGISDAKVVCRQMLNLPQSGIYRLNMHSQLLTSELLPPQHSSEMESHVPSWLELYIIRTPLQLCPKKIERERVHWITRYSLITSSVRNSGSSVQRFMFWQQYLQPRN